MNWIGYTPTNKNFIGFTPTLSATGTSGISRLRVAFFANTLPSEFVRQLLTKSTTFIINTQKFATQFELSKRIMTIKKEIQLIKNRLDYSVDASERLQLLVVELYELEKQRKNHKDS
jgi:hypothetical protein